MGDKKLTIEQTKAIALIRNYEDQIASFNIQKSRLGIFQGKRKKEIEARVNDLNNKIIGLKIIHHIPDDID